MDEIRLKPCPHCGQRVPLLSVSFAVIARVVAVLSEGSPIRAATEVKVHAGCAEATARKWIDHFQACHHTWPLTETDLRVLDRIDDAFGSVQKPAHFTDYGHCDECKEHDDTLRSQTKETIGRNHLGTAGWDPITFTTAEGVAYYFPALARFALRPAIGDRDWYGDQLLWHLCYGAEANKLLRWCNAHQKTAVYELLEHIAESKAQEINNCLADKELAAALEIWKRA